jgi:hypothetical protein
LASSVSVSAGTNYWICLLVPAGDGTVRFRDVLTASTQPSETSAQTTLGALPATWSTGRVYQDGPLSAYGSASAAGGSPVLAVSPSSISFSAVTGGSDPSAKQATVSNTGGGTLTWTATTNAPWLTVTPSSGVGAATVNVVASIAGLTAGSYSATVTVTAAGVQGSPQTVGVTLTVTSPPPPPPTTTVLLGDQQVEATTDYNNAGTAEAFRALAGASGSLTRLSVYLDSSSTATQVIVGVYSDAGGDPGTLLAQGTLTAPVPGAWNNVPLPATMISSGTPYWVAMLAPGGSGTLRFRDRANSGGACETSAAANLTQLPATWVRGTVYADGPASLYGATS